MGVVITCEVPILPDTVLLVVMSIVWMMGHRLTVVIVDDDIGMIQNSKMLKISATFPA